MIDDDDGRLSRDIPEEVVENSKNEGGGEGRGGDLTIPTMLTTTTVKLLQHGEELAITCLSL